MAYNRYNKKIIKFDKKITPNGGLRVIGGNLSVKVPGEISFLVTAK